VAARWRLSRGTCTTSSLSSTGGYCSQALTTGAPLNLCYLFTTSSLSTSISIQRIFTTRTYSAASVNCENAIVTNDMFFVGRYANEFTRLWQSFSANTRRASNVRRAKARSQLEIARSERSP
jgi:hypothetical protein